MCKNQHHAEDDQFSSVSNGSRLRRNIEAAFLLHVSVVHIRICHYHLEHAYHEDDRKLDVGITPECAAVYAVRKARDHQRDARDNSHPMVLLKAELLVHIGCLESPYAVLAYVHHQSRYRKGNRKDAEISGSVSPADNSLNNGALHRQHRGTHSIPDVCTAVYIICLFEKPYYRFKHLNYTLQMKHLILPFSSGGISSIHSNTSLYSGFPYSSSTLRE